ncbi:MAG: ATP-binding protein [Rhodopseudomonas palustris]|nr:ATP-binding protein [Rhodopseudomonas palustris]
MRRFDRRLISPGADQHHQERDEAIEAVPPETRLDKGTDRCDCARVDAMTTSSSTCIDNGIGLPKTSRSRLLEPYVTTREKGTGLGLAIVGRGAWSIMAAALNSTTHPSVRPGCAAPGCGCDLRFRVNRRRLPSEGTPLQKRHRTMDVAERQRATGVIDGE